MLNPLTNDRRGQITFRSFFVARAAVLPRQRRTARGVASMVWRHMTYYRRLSVLNYIRHEQTL